MNMSIPALLSGPIIRRAEQSAVYIWIATSKNFTIEAELYDMEEGISTPIISKRSLTETVQVGKQLFIHLIQVLPKGRFFPSNKLIGYNLFFHSGKKLLDLESFGLLSPQNPHAIIYEGQKYPTFYINTDAKSNILYGSCRKPHGKGDDALVNADLTLEETYLNVEERPNALFLMGDQIYADDVADPLLPFIQALGEELIGKKEELQQLDEQLANNPLASAINKIHGRQFIMKHIAKFTSNHAANHMIQLGEFAVLYLLSWSPQIWDLAAEFGVFDSFEEKDSNGEYYYIYPDLACFQKEREKERQQHQQQHQEQLQDIYRFKQSLFRVRRALANIPTYMIFDDHDITDDWNLSQNWKNNVYSSPLGKHIISNGLAAYWLFQGWGNEPEIFDKSFKHILMNYFSNPSIEKSNYQNYVQSLLDFDSWHFVAPTNPTAVFLDTRTHRAFDATPKPTKLGNTIEENIRSPQLISSEGFSKISKKLRKSGWKSGSPLAIVSATPLYGIGLIESFLHDYVYPFRILGVPVHSMLDFEAWKYNGQGFNAFHRWVSRWNPSHCFILSGDVHYAASLTAKVDFPNGKQSNIYQFTSSPMNNMSFSGLWGQLLKQVIWFNTLKRKRKNIYRHCDDAYNLIVEASEHDCPAEYQWRETIRYLSLSNNEIMETDNNLGLLQIEADVVENKLLKYYGLHKQVLTYKKLELH